MTEIAGWVSPKYANLINFILESLQFLMGMDAHLMLSLLKQKKMFV